jgi:hypothetical protein
VRLRVVVPALSGEEDQEIAYWSRALLADLSDVSGAAVDPVEVRAPEGAKGLAATAGALAARVGAERVKALIEAVRAFTARTGRTVEISIDGDVLRLTGASREVQQLAIESWLARHPGS